MQRENLSLQPSAAAQDPSLLAEKMLGSTAEHELSRKVEGQDGIQGRRGDGMARSVWRWCTFRLPASFPMPPASVYGALLRDSRGCNYVRISTSPRKGFQCVRRR